MSPDPLPTISIVTPSYNGDAYLRGMLSRLQSQTYGRWEHIVTDNASGDDTLKILDEYADPRRIVISEPDSGQSNAINKGFERATGEVLCWLNVDDYYVSDDVLQTIAEAFASRDVDIVYGHGFWRYEPEGTEKPVWIDPDASNVGTRFKRHLGLCQPAVFWTRDALRRIGPVDESLHYAMDFDLWC
jgi:glycosyltransferase involved in cell wall biosynthesis